MKIPGSLDAVYKLKWSLANATLVANFTFDCQPEEDRLTLFVKRLDVHPFLQWEHSIKAIARQTGRSRNTRAPGPA